MKCSGLKGNGGESYESLSLAMFNMAAVSGCQHEATHETKVDGIPQYFCGDCRPDGAKEIKR